MTNNEEDEMNDLWLREIRDWRFFFFFFLKIWDENFDDEFWKPTEESKNGTFKWQFFFYFIH